MTGGSWSLRDPAPKIAIKEQVCLHHWTSGVECGRWLTCKSDAAGAGRWTHRSEHAAPAVDRWDRQTDSVPLLLHRPCGILDEQC